MVSSLGALCVLELGLLFPTSGGTYVYMYELGDIVAFLYAWLSVLISRPSSGKLTADLNFRISFEGFLTSVNRLKSILYVELTKAAIVGISFSEYVAQLFSGRVGSKQPWTRDQQETA